MHTAYLQSGPDMADVNVAGSANVARAAAAAGARLIHLSTDFVFDGDKDGAYREDDEPAPVTPYGESKLAAERAVAAEHPAALLVRTSLLYAGPQPGPHERLVADAIAGTADVGFFTDELRCPIAVGDLAAALLELLDGDLRGPLHVAGSETVSRYRFAALVAERRRARPRAAAARSQRRAARAAAAQLRARLLAGGGGAGDPAARPVRGARSGRPADLHSEPMATAVSSLARIRSAAVSARGFQTAALVTLALLWLVVTTGGLVRLTASGLGCPHWPTCEANQLVPSASYHAVIEFTNRVISGVAMLAAVATAIMAYRVPGLKRGVARAAALAAAGTVAQVPLGALTVAFDLHPLLVMSHFLLAMAVVAASTWVTVRAWRLAHGGEPRPLDVPRVGVAAWAAVAACLVLVTTGAFVTAAGPHAGSTDKPIERLGDFYDAAWVHVRAAVIFSTLFVIVAVWLWRKARGSVPQRLSVAGVVLTLCQLAVGEYQYRNGLPWGVIAVHVAIAATLVVTVVTIAALIRDSAD